ncbi:tetratricopeptide repeat protein [Aquiflexum gelatinilyticum]|uniref:Tetratricopeptide repeat protein n=1 Tax=Aquiflexum gelatinilyticum TaxID=2961943 RepID=A0A9X2SZU6_9BACT|nr:tetratricopeptide repeat protein [Aquiflexum gelatinilyticum]MCR9014241.1 tetratricopeptide repeat protein [Aquiflexum gelatinilyticum]
MKKSQILVLILGVATIGILYSLPRVVVDNEEGSTQITEDQPSSAQKAEELHDAPMEAEDREVLSGLLKNFDTQENKEKIAALSDQIASIYIKAGKFDSAAYTLDRAAVKLETPQSWEKAGAAYYEAYTFALDQEKVSLLAEKTRTYLTKVLEQDPKRLDLKTKMAMTYVSSANPMQGITMLREVLEEDPTNEDGLFNMGVLSMQSGQYKRAAERFEELVKHHPENVQGQFYLGVSYFESKQNNKAKQQFELVQSMSKEPMVLASVEGYLERL